AWYLGSPRRPTGVSIHVRVDPGCPLPAGGLGLGLLTPSGGTRPAPPLTPVTNGSGAAGVTLDGTTSAAGVVVANSSARAITDDPLTGNQTVVVSTPRPSRVVRSVAAAPGWSATVRTGPPAAASHQVAVAAAGALVQSVPVPAGTSTVTWRYRPASVTVGAA